MLKQKLHEMSSDASRDSLFPINYFAERLPTPAKTQEEQLDYVFHLFEILSETEQMSYFRSSFIQRLIEYHWNGPLVRFYSVVSGFYLLSFALILTSIISMQYMSEEPYICLVIRLYLALANLIILSVSLLSFEIKSFLEDKLGYIKSFWN